MATNQQKVQLMINKPLARLAMIAAAIVVVVSVSVTSQPHLADACQEDENWITVDHLDPRGREDVHGVSRACVNSEDDS